jgi:hypothetical protein
MAASAIMREAGVPARTARRRVGWWWRGPFTQESPTAASRGPETVLVRMTGSFRLLYAVGTLGTYTCNA